MTTTVLKRKRSAPAAPQSLSRALVCVALVSSLGALAQSTGGKDVKAPTTWRRAVRLDLVRPAQAMGDHLQKSGKERVTLSGQLTLGEQTPVPVTLTRELPDKVRLSRQGKGKDLLFEGAANSKGDSSLDKNDEGLLETLVYDWPDQFLVNHSDGSKLRLVVRRARLQESGRATGAFCDIYDVLDEVQVAKTTRVRSARYCVNSDTALIDRVHYQTASDSIEVRFSEWRVVDGQRFPGRIERLENGKTTATLTLSAGAFAQAANDGVFTRTDN